MAKKNPHHRFRSVFVLEKLFSFKKSKFSILPVFLMSFQSSNIFVHELIKEIIKFDSMLRFETNKTIILSDIVDRMCIVVLDMRVIGEVGPNSYHPLLFFIEVHCFPFV